MPIVDEHVRSVGRDVRELARLHGELARVEVQSGSRRLLTALFLLGFGVMMGTLFVVALGAALFVWMRTVVTAPAAALIVALAFARVMLIAWTVAWRLIRSADGLLLPRTRTMLWELLRWRDEPTSSSGKSEPDAAT